MCSARKGGAWWRRDIVVCVLDVVKRGKYVDDGGLTEHSLGGASGLFNGGLQAGCCRISGLVRGTAGCILGTCAGHCHCGAECRDLPSVALRGKIAACSCENLAKPFLCYIVRTIDRMLLDFRYVMRRIALYMGKWLLRTIVRKRTRIDLGKAF